MAQPDLRQLPRNDQVVLGAGVVAFIWSLLPLYYGVSVKFGGFKQSESYNAWHWGWNVLAMLLILAAALVVAAETFASSSMPKLPVTLNFLAAALSVLGTVILIIRTFTIDSASVPGASIGLKWGAYILLILCIVQSVFTVLRLRSTGEAMPWQQRTGSTPPPAEPHAP